MTKSSHKGIIIVARFHVTFKKQLLTHEMPYFLTFQAVGWADVFSRKVYRDFILENLAYCRKEKGLFLFGYVIMTNHLHLIVQQKDAKLSEWVRDFKKFTSKRLLKMILENPQESRKEWLKINFAYHAKFNRRAGDMQFWTHEIEHEENLTQGDDYNCEIPSRFLRHGTSYDH